MSSLGPYAPEAYLKQLVGQALGKPSADAGEPQPSSEAENMYGMPPTAPPAAQESTPDTRGLLGKFSRWYNGTPEQQQFISKLMGGNPLKDLSQAPVSAPEGYGMGPRFAALVQKGGLGSVAGAVAPVASAAVSGASGTMPAAPAIMKGFQALSVRPPQGENNFANAGPPANINELRERLGFVESGGRYDAKNPISDASGKYQYRPGTWNNHGGYKTAAEAPPDVQDQRAHEDLANRLFASKGDVPQAVATHIYPKWAGDISKWNTPIPGNGTETLTSYATKVLGKDTVQKYVQDQLAKQAMADHSDQRLYNLSAR